MIVIDWYLTARLERKRSSKDVEPNPSCAHLGPVARWILNTPRRNLMVDAEACGYANYYYYERVADCTRCRKLSKSGTDTMHHSKGYATAGQSSRDHLRT